MQILFYTSVPGPQGPFCSYPFTLFRSYSAGPKYDVNGVELTRESILSLDPAQRTIAHWLVLVDWDLQRQRPYVIIDPYDPTGLLYLNSAEYLVQARTLASSNVPFIVVARPGTVKPVPTKTPPLGEGRIGCTDAIYGSSNGRNYRRIGRIQRHIPENLGSQEEFRTGYSQATWSEFSDLRKWIQKNVTWGEGGTVRVNDGNIMGLLVMWAREILHFLDAKSPGRRIEQLTPLIRHLQTLLRHNGPGYTIQRLKISLFCLYSYVAGAPVSTDQLAELGHRVRLRGGLPYFLDRSLRESLRVGAPNTIRFCASLLNTYKVFWEKHGPSPLTTIEAKPFKGDIGDFSEFVTSGDGFYGLWGDHIGKLLPGWEYQTSMGYLIASAGANSSCAMSSIYLDSLAWENAGRHLPREWFEKMGDTKALTFLSDVTSEASEWWNNVNNAPNNIPNIAYDKYDEHSRISPTFLRLLGKIEGDPEYSTRPSDSYLENLWSIVRGSGPDWSFYRTTKEAFLDGFYASLQHRVRIGIHPTRMTHSTPLTGRLHSIPEPAGKVRVVAICDYFTQIGLKPVHEYLFKLLKRNTNDATFGQNEAVDQFASKGYKEIFSYDLKAATDLIPTALYSEVLTPLIGRIRADLWVQLLSDRNFLAPKDVRKGGQEFVRYSCGQPMGALSSWAGLAMVHHAIVQFAAKRAGFTCWFTAYLVLGDDIVIADASVADQYLKVCAEFAIKVSLSKSLISRNGLMNFASQTLLGSTNLSPISFGEELVAQNWARRIEMAKRIDHRYGGGESGSAKSSMLTLRRAVTANQWASLQGELTGAVSEAKLRFIRFILQNPFNSLTEVDRLHIDSLMEWLGLLCPQLFRVSRSQLDSLKTAIMAALWDDLKNTVSKRISEYSAGVKTSAEIVNRSGYGTFESGTKLWRYLSTCVSDHLKKFREDVYAIEDAIKAESTIPHLAIIGDLWLALSRIPPVSSAFGDDPRLNLFSFIKGQTLGEDLLSCPVRVGKLGAVQGKLPAPKVPKETLRAPLQALLLGVARALGVFLPAMKLIDRPVSGSFGQVLKTSLLEFEDNRAMRDASPCWQSSPLVPVVIPVPIPEVLSLVGPIEDD